MPYRGCQPALKASQSQPSQPASQPVNPASARAGVLSMSGLRCSMFGCLVFGVRVRDACSVFGVLFGVQSERLFLFKTMFGSSVLLCWLDTVRSQPCRKSHAQAYNFRVSYDTRIIHAPNLAYHNKGSLGSMSIPQNRRPHPCACCLRASVPCCAHVSSSAL